MPKWTSIFTCLSCFDLCFGLICHVSGRSVTDVGSGIQDGKDGGDRAFVESVPMGRPRPEVVSSICGITVTAALLASLPRGCTVTNCTGAH